MVLPLSLFSVSEDMGEEGRMEDIVRNEKEGRKRRERKEEGEKKER